MRTLHPRPVTGNMLLSYDAAPESVRRLAVAFMEAIGPRVLWELPTDFFLIFGAGTGLGAAEHVAAIRWLSDWHAAQEKNEGSVIDRMIAHDTAEKLAAYATALEKAAAAKAVP